MYINNDLSITLDASVQLLLSQTRMKMLAQ